jgi:WD40 repeat protein
LSTPHLYISALATWSTGSALSQQWKKQFLGLPSFIHRRASDVPLTIISAGATIYSTALSPDGTCIISGSGDNSVRVWDASTGIELKVLNGHTDDVNSVAFSPDGTHIVSGSSDNSVRVWDASTGIELKVLNGHSGTVFSTAFSPDGTHIVSGSSDNSVRVWDASTGIELKVLNGHSGVVISTAFSSDGTHIVSGSDDNSVRVWDTLTSSIENACFAVPDQESARLVIVSQPYPAWATRPDQWILSLHGEYKLIWVPEMAYPYSIFVISCQGSALVSFYDCNIGCDWANCYSSS